MGVSGGALGVPCGTLGISSRGRVCPYCRGSTRGSTRIGVSSRLGVLERLWWLLLIHGRLRVCKGRRPCRRRGIPAAGAAPGWSVRPAEVVLVGDGRSEVDEGLGRVLLVLGQDLRGEKEEAVEKELQ